MNFLKSEMIDSVVIGLDNIQISKEECLDTEYWTAAYEMSKQIVVGYIFKTVVIATSTFFTSTNLRGLTSR